MDRTHHLTIWSFNSLNIRVQEYYAAHKLCKLKKQIDMRKKKFWGNVRIMVPGSYQNKIFKVYVNPYSEVLLAFFLSIYNTIKAFCYKCFIFQNLLLIVPEILWADKFLQLLINYFRLNNINLTVTSIHAKQGRWINLPAGLMYAESQSRWLSEYLNKCFTKTINFWWKEQDHWLREFQTVHQKSDESVWPA